jgi:lambda repressor-like predicted transcriptional regulator
MTRMFPVLSSSRSDCIPDAPRSIPWDIVAPHEAQARENHYQSLERLAQRGGLGWDEMAAVLEDRPWRKMDIQEAYRTVMKIVAAGVPAPKSPPAPPYGGVRLFPILSSYSERIPGAPRSIPWDIVAPHEAQAKENHDQSLERLAQRGGLGWDEMAAVLEDRRWRKMDEQEAYRTVMKIVDALWKAPPGPKPPGP